MMSHDGFTVQRDREILVQEIGILEASEWPEGRENRANCPIHHGDTSKDFSFRLQSDSRGSAWRCHKCGEQGGILALIEKALMVSHTEAIRIYWPQSQGRRISKRSVRTPVKAASRVVVPSRSDGPANGPSRAEERGERPRPRKIEFLYQETAGGPFCLKKTITRGAIGKDGKPDKEPRWDRLTDYGTWESGLGGRKAFLYKWDAVLEGLKSGKLEDRKIVFLVEGEQKADIILEAGLPATYITGGITDGILQAAADIGLEWVILPDADPIAPTNGKRPGQVNAEKWAKALLERQIRVSVLHLPDLNQEAKEDVQDWAWGRGWLQPDAERGTYLADPEGLKSALLDALNAREACLVEASVPSADEQDEEPKKKGRATLSVTAQAVRDLSEDIGAVYLETFSNKLHVSPGPALEGSLPRPWTDHDLLKTTEFLQLHGGLPSVSRAMTEDAVSLVAGETKKDVLVDYLNDLEWDGVPRVRTWLERAYGVTLDPYFEAVGKVWILGMVARAMRPGCKMDDMPILEGPQGIRKSQSIQVLAGAEWFADLEYVPNDKDFILQIQGRWLVEISELQGFNKAEANGIKGFLSRQTDPVRRPYGRIVEDLGRRCVLVGTTNNHEYLRDATGGRRFWPVPVQRVDLDWIRDNRDQLFAEGVALYKAGEPWWVEDPDVKASAREIQESRTQEDTWTTPIKSWLIGQSESVGITTAEILAKALDIPADRQKQPEQNRVHNIMTALGWAKKQETLHGTRGRFWRKTTP